VHLEYVRHISGPNVYTTAPVAVARFELDDLTGRETTDFPGFTERLTLALPGLRDHHCAAGRPGGFTDALRRGTYFGHVVEHVMLELSALAGRDVHLGRTMWAGADGRYDVMTECPCDEPDDSVVPQELYRLALTVVQELLAKQRPRFSTELETISTSTERERLGPSTAAIAAAARRRGIPVRRVGGLSMLRLGYGCYRRLVSAAMTEQTSALGVDIAADKVLAKRFLDQAGIPVPDGLVAHSADEAVRALDRLGGQVVIKPKNGNHGKCVTVGVGTPEQAEQAYQRAAAGSGAAAVLVETYIPGNDYRVLVVDGRVVAAAQLRPAAVTGDGEATIAELIESVNADPRRGPGHSRPLTKIAVDDVTLAQLAASGLRLDSVPAAGQQVSLRQNGNLSTGGTSRDVTDFVHEDVAELCRRAAGAAGLDICGIDLRLADISEPVVGGQPTAVIEINACPGLRMHLAPEQGRPRDVAEAIIDRLYPPGAPSRIPIVAVTGTNGKTTTVRMIAHVLRFAGLHTGMSCTDGVHIGDRCVLEADASGPRSAQLVLDDTSVEAAVLETARGGIIRGGLGYDQADVAVITNISGDHLGNDGLDELEDLIDVKALVAEQVAVGGSVVLNASDPNTAAIATRKAVRRATPVIRYFSAAPACGVLERHKRSGGICYELRDGQLTETDGGRQRVILDVSELPGAFGGRARHVVANALAAIAACRAVGVSAKDISGALRTFVPADANPGRGNVYAVPAVTEPGLASRPLPVLVDYGHNAAALLATGELVASSWGGAPAAALTLPGDRRDDVITEAAQAVATWFASVVIYEDDDLRGRAPGEMRELISGALRAARPGITIRHAAGAHDALHEAVTLAGGSPVLFIYEKLAAARAALDALGAVPWPSDDLACDSISDRMIDDLAREIANAADDDSAHPLAT
jgi:cyanophycin synthetase